MRLLQRCASLFGRGRSDSDPAMDALLDADLSGIRNTDPDTRIQWMRLHRSLVQSKAESRKPAGSMIPKIAVAAAMTAAVLVTVYVYLIPQHVSPDMFATGRGEQQRLTLSDGSEVTLNYATELAVAELRPGNPRLLDLRGEAYFKVSKNETPFVVSTGFADVQVLGTEFNVRVRDGVLEVAVVRGKVKVSATKDGIDSTIVLVPRQMALCVEGEYPQRIGDVPFAGYPGWMNRKIFLSRTSLAAACEEIELRFDVHVTIDNTELRREVLTGVLEAQTAESAVNALCRLTGSKFTHEGQEFTIY